MKLVRQQQSILVVNNRVEVLDEVATALTGASFVCRCCTNAEDAIAAAESSPPDLVISDVNLDGKSGLDGQSGLDMCGQIREKAAPREVPVMLLCAAQVPDVIRRSDASGGTYYLRKPFAADVLLELIDTALGSPQLVAGNVDQG